MKNTHITVLSTLVLLGFALPSQAFDLVGAWQAARGYNADFAVSRAQRDAGQEKLVQGRSQLLPQVSATGNYAYNNPLQPKSSVDQFGNPITDMHYETHGYSLNLQQPLFDVSKYTGYKKGAIGTEQADTAFDAAEQQLILDISQAYFDVLRARDTLAATRASKKTFMNQLQQAKTAFEVGTATITDTNEAQAGYDGAVAQEISDANNLELAENNLKRLTGLEPTGIQTVRDQLPLDPPKPAGLDAWIDLALHNSLKIKNAEQSLQLAEHNVTEKRGGHLPTVNFTAGYNDSISNQPGVSLPGQQHSRSSQVGVTVNIPLFNGGGINSLVREAIAQRDAAQDQLESTRRQVREDVRKAFLGVTNGAALVRAQQQLLVSAKSKVDSTRLGKEVGIRTSIDLLQAEQSYYTALTSLANAKYNYLTARLALAQSAGQLQPQTLAEVNQVIVR
ncbi:TolC family outer membrane protein [Chromobacterium sp. IIBBL 290-4]|uniref:TolC family outer membrane protein n=1 Tax=Chromobacterium sp. IIBBL 290-4 TaxID=2953890 RepID=UPI0020B66379|nr:TolC family outer membrane protein [Chromobacterium sp. IIBBL 290-4]UTH76660.1 TolC family outer membrane protein [Chromobacterium sp. IIBBL 290-4]